MFVLFCFAVVTFACGRPECKNDNPVFEQYSPQSQVYKAELLKQFQTVDKSDLTYWFSEYVESEGEALLYFNVQGKNLCAKIVLNVENWNKLDLLRQKKGISFRGAEFRNLTYETRHDSLGIRFIYRDVDRIID